MGEIFLPDSPGSDVSKTSAKDSVFTGIDIRSLGLRTIRLNSTVVSFDRSGKLIKLDSSQDYKADIDASGFITRATDLNGIVYDFGATGQIKKITRVDGSFWDITFSDTGSATTEVISDSFSRKALIIKTNVPYPKVSIEFDGFELYTVLYDSTSKSFIYRIGGEVIETFYFGEPGHAFVDGTTILCGSDSFQNTFWEALLTGVADGNGARTEDYLYSCKGQAIGEYFGSMPATKTSIMYAGYSSEVTSPNGIRSDLQFNIVGGRYRLVGQSQPAGSGCNASSSAIAYDANGNVASRDDFNGSRVCYASDLSRNLETTRVEGLANTASCSSVTPANAALPLGSRKVSSQWHPDWRLQSKVAEPGKLTTSIYNGQPDPFNSNAIASCAPATALLPDGKPIAVLCKTVEQATTDGDGHLGFTAVLQPGVANRVRSWTYTQYGQVLTAKDPLGNTTTNTYYPDTSFTGVNPNAVGHTIGDLQTVTNALGKVTSYGQYDKHGNLLQSTDPNGVVTTNSYDLRQRLLSTSVGGQTTGYTYDAAGQLLKVTAPDASWIGYEYDPAHRMTATKDNLGNRIEYVLDNAGNRTAENVKGTGGALRRTLARSIDALGRVQQTTGRE